jgi:hypothetical protein
MSSQSVHTRLWWSSSLLCAVVLPFMAHATLGEPESSVRADGDQMQLPGSIKSTDRAAFRTHELALPSGTTLREYANLDGLVFAVTWNGPFMPDLQQILGRYFAQYSAGAKANKLDHRHLQIRDSDFVVQASGHLHAFSGRAYLPQAVPGGVVVGDLP